jgi:hypothetical protein
MSSIRRRLIASWLIILELQNRTWADGSRPRIRVDRLGITTLPAFACLVCLAMILSHLVDGTVGSARCSMIFGRMIRGNAPGMLPCIFFLCVRTFICITRFELGYLHSASLEYLSPFELAGD